MAIFKNSPPIVTDGLVLYLDAANTKSYPTTGTTWNDLLGTNNGTLTNGPTFSSDNGGSIVFDGTNDYVSMGNILNSVFAGTNNRFTLTSWVYRNSDGIQGAVISKLYTVLNERQFSLAYRNGLFDIALYGTPDVSSWIRLVGTVNTFPPQRWYQVCCTYDGSINTNDGLDRVKIYVNGVSQTVQLTFTQGTLDNTMLSSTSQLAIGAGVGSTGASQFLLDGRVAQSQIYNRILTASEVLQNYNATKQRYNLT